MSNNLQRKFPFRQLFLHLYLLAMFGIFPVFCTRGFFNIRHDRANFYIVASMMLFALCIILWVWERKDQKQTIPVKPWYHRLSVTDWAMLGFLLVSILSTLFSKHLSDALLGTVGRGVGLLMMVIYVGVYFLVSRCSRYRQYLLMALGITSAFVGLVAVLNYYYLDPLKMLEPLSPSDQIVFISTIGNKNFLSAYLCITIPVLTILFVQVKERPLRWFYLICAGFSAAGLSATDSDSGILGMGVFIAVYLIWYARNVLRLKRFCLALTVLLLFVKLTLLLPGPNKDTGSIHHQLVTSPLTTALLFAMIVVTVVLYYTHGNNRKMQFPQTVPTVLCCVFGGVVLFLLLGMLYFTVIDPDAPLSKGWSVLRIDEEWGTKRGGIWLASWEAYRQASFWQKLFGCGPDTFYHVITPLLPERGTVNAAHNEYLNYQITIGILGLGCYLTAIGSAIFHCVKTWKKDRFAPVYCAAVICYSAQAIVNIAQPITTPLFFLFLSLCARQLPPKKPKKRKPEPEPVDPDEPVEVHNPFEELPDTQLPDFSNMTTEEILRSLDEYL